MGAFICKVTNLILGICSTLIPIGIACIIGLQLSDTAYSFNLGLETLTGDNPLNVTEDVCLLGKDAESDSLCTYMYVVIGVSLLATLILSIIQCCTCNLCGLGRIFDVILSVLIEIWWCIAGGIVTKGAGDANDANLPEESWRNTVVVLIWVEVAVLALFIVTSLCTLCR